MTINTITPNACAELLVAKHKAITEEINALRNADEAQRPAMSRDLKAIGKIPAARDLYILSGFAGRNDADTVAERFIEGVSKGDMVFTIIVQSPLPARAMDAELETIKKMRERSGFFYILMLDEKDPDQTPFMIVGVMGEAEAKMSSPDYAVELVAKAKLARKEEKEQGKKPSKRNKKKKMPSYKVWDVA